MNKPNIILLTIDTLRADRLGCYGYTRALTPNLDQLAASGVQFNQAMTGGSWTQAAFPVILTSSYAAMHGGCLGPLAQDRPSPIGALTAQGYRTAGFSTSPLLSSAYGYQQGFQDFTDFVPNERDPALRKIRGGQKLLRSPMTHRILKILGVQSRPAQLYVSADKLTDALCDWLDSADTPFFAWAHFMDVHWPYHREEGLTEPRTIAQAWQDLSHLHDANWYGEPISEMQKAHYIELYEQALKFTDVQVGKLLTYLEKSGKIDNTIIVVVSDHGEEFLEHHRWGHWENNLHDEILHVPLIIRLPTPPPKNTIDAQVRTLDIMPTLLDLCGCDALQGMKGQSLVPLIRGETNQGASVSLSEMWRDTWHIIAVRTETHKYIWNSKTPNEPELFDLKTDSYEQNNIAETHPDLVSTLHQHVKTHMENVVRTMPKESIAAPDLDDEIVARLRDLGYME